MLQSAKTLYFAVIFEELTILTPQPLAVWIELPNIVVGLDVVSPSALNISNEALSVLA